MPDTGFIQIRAYTSTAQFPLENVAITVTAPDGTAIAMRLTDKSGRITPIEIPVPDRGRKSASICGHYHHSESGDDPTG